MIRFKEYLKESRISHEKNIILNEEMFGLYNFLNEGIIIPNTVIIKTLDVDELNSDEEFKALNITFITSKDSYYKNGKIFIGMKDINSKSELSSKIGHELIHAIQDEKSNKRYLNFHNNLEKLWKKFIQNKGSQLELNLIRNTIIEIRDFKNPYERMAYAYEFVSIGKNLGYNLHEIIKFTLDVFPEFQKDKQYMTYMYKYFEVL